MKKRARSLPSRDNHGSAVPKQRRRIGVIVSLSLFVIQFSLSLLLHPISQILCLEELNGSSTAAAHDHHHDGVLSHSHPEPTGDSFQHCKDTVYGIAVTPMQPFSLPHAAPIPSLSARWVPGPEVFVPLDDRTPSPLLQPPRA